MLLIGNDKCGIILIIYDYKVVMVYKIVCNDIVKNWSCNVIY